MRSGGKEIQVDGKKPDEMKFYTKKMNDPSFKGNTLIPEMPWLKEEGPLKCKHKLWKKDNRTFYNFELEDIDTTGFECYDCGISYPLDKV